MNPQSPPAGEARAEVLAPETAKLVDDFAEAMKEKFLAAQIKYGKRGSTDWMRNNWADECRVHLLEHVYKGDPRDVANYCAFLWFHGWSSAPQPAAPVDEASERAAFEAWYQNDILPSPVFSVTKDIAWVTWKAGRAQPAAPMDEGGERAAFEAWACNRFDLRHPDALVLKHIWEAWQAGRAQLRGEGK